MLARNWKRRWLPLCLARRARTVSMGWPVVKSNEIKSKLACILEASESTRLRMEESLPNHHDDHIAGKWDYSLQHYNLVHKFVPMPQASSGQGMGKLEKIPAWNLTKVRSKKVVFDEARRRAQKFILPHWWTSVIWRMPNWRQSTKNTKVELYSDVIFWKMILDLMQYSLNKVRQHHKWQQQRSWISYPDCQGVQDKQRMQYLLIRR